MPDGVEDLSEFGMPTGNVQKPRPQPQSSQQPQPSQQPKQEHAGFFSQKPPAQDPRSVQLMGQIAEAGRRIRTLEDRYSNIRRKTQVTDQNMLSIQKNLTREIKTVDEQLNDMEKNTNELNSKVKQILQEMKNMARSEDVKVLKRYLDFWKPVDFITKKDAERMIRAILEENRNI